MLALLGVCTLVRQSLATDTRCPLFEVPVQLVLQLLWRLEARGKQSLQRWSSSHLVSVPTVHARVDCHTTD